MDKMLITGGYQLNGQVAASGAKNSALPILFSTLLAEGEHHFDNVPLLKDIESTAELLQSLGCDSHREGHSFKVHVTKLKSFEAHYDLVRKMRASILCLGPILAKYGEAVVSLPGGCAIGTRPIDLHLDAMKQLGAEIELKDGYVLAKAKKLKGGTVFFEKTTVGGTENLMMAATLAEGVTIIENAAKEPEIVDLANYLNKMGAKITGHGTSVMRIEGVDKLTPARHSIMPDRIEAGTLLIAGAITSGEVEVTHCQPHDLEALILKMRESGFKIETTANSIKVFATKTWEAVDITTAPHPLFPTDLQAQFMALMTVARGTSVITETVFENRFMHVNELMRLGADITPKSQVAVVRGKPDGLTAAPVMATDLRASASLVLAGLIAKGETTVGRIYHLDRGYEGLETKLSALGAKVRRAH
ncbi:UDP-N-acetylglucosamine 1-carboxyvinyltransferase [Pseudobdellovibrio exovorus]|uniref:UDP-N-acetylglucosamine 1-carboxyvinyltransferase n=1 Tax=Pseudobdellovibrio exovorus JSS TaxID=1184267 RepID=M4V790_9BACT|nr:UDP-N-acetylglucosamine 1-carboxyvinyltransferase [Pseudobdellovibrio exovorus]AGH94305.1 UDP-N-acetylglucosamine enolpyruvyl transferase [Pseudobdellovibrio exovorus JSS]